MSKKFSSYIERNTRCTYKNYLKKNLVKIACWCVFLAVLSPFNGDEFNKQKTFHTAILLIICVIFTFKHRKNNVNTKEKTAKKKN